MKERILFLLNNLLRFDATVVKTFFSVASVRYEKDYNGEITELLQHAERYPLFLKDKSKSKLIAELKILDTENLRHFIDHQDLPPAYQEYLQTLLQLCTKIIKVVYFCHTNSSMQSSSLPHNSNTKKTLKIQIFRVGAGRVGRVSWVRSGFAHPY